MLTRLLLLAVAGAAGALSRYGLSSLTQAVLGSRFPWGTALVNILGCLVAGFLFGLFESRWALFGEARIIAMVGFLGAFTTFSSFMVDTTGLLRDAGWLMAVGNVLLQNGLGFAALCAGLAVSRLV